MRKGLGHASAFAEVVESVHKRDDVHFVALSPKFERNIFSGFPFVAHERSNTHQQPFGDRARQRINDVHAGSKLFG